MISVSYTPSFLKQAKSLENRVYRDLKKKIELLKNPQNHKVLKVHKLHDRLYGCYAFSITHSIRVIFEYTTKSEVLFHDVGGHEIY
ncbi:MAG: type II toxin-antitoxin system mRNA interferase toxin, RelE/StbE family [Patescibacteria group bacterium]